VRSHRRPHHLSIPSLANTGIRGSQADKTGQLKNIRTHQTRAYFLHRSHALLTLLLSLSSRLLFAGGDALSTSLSLLAPPSDEPRAPASLPSAAAAAAAAWTHSSVALVRACRGPCAVAFRAGFMLACSLGSKKEEKRKR